MTLETYVAATALPVSASEAFGYHDRPGALQRLIPPWEKAFVERSDNSLAVGSQVVLTTKFMGIPLRWLAEHTHYEPPNFFADTQVSGPFAQWDHEHRFPDQGEDHCLLRDQLTYRLPMGKIGHFFGRGIATRAIESMFAYRHQVTRDDLDLMQRYDSTTKRVAISGASGLVGRQLSALLRLLGHDTRPIVRKPTDQTNDIAAWSDPTQAKKFQDVDTVIHLAGKPIADGRWSDKVKQEIRDSRVAKTRQLCESLASLDVKPKTLICASATGFYGSRKDEVLTEDSPPGDDFLAGVCQQWEDACQPAVDAGIRVVNARIGIVLSPRGGALQKMLLPAKFAGGALGSGKQWWSWIALDDVLGAIYHLMQDESVSGAVNLVSPEPIQNADFARVLGRVVRRPAIFPAPAFVLRAMVGEMADALLLSSARVQPNKLTASDYHFRLTDLESTLRYYLGRNRLESIE